MSSLTAQQRRYAEARFAGLGKKDAAMAAGCPEKTASPAGSRLERHPNVVAHLARLKAAESDANPTAGRDAAPPPTEGGEYIEDPMVLLQSVMNDRKEDRKIRLQAAIALLPYTHQKLGEGGKKDQQANDAAGVVKGRFAPASPPPQLKLVG